MRRLLPLLALVTLLGSIGAPTRARAQQAPVDSLAVGRTFTRWFYTGKGDSVFARLAPKMREKMPNPDAVNRQYQAVTGAAGDEDSVIREEITPREAGGFIYRRTAKFKKVSIPFQLIWTVMPDGMVDGLLIGTEQMLRNAQIR